MSKVGQISGLILLDHVGAEKEHFLNILLNPTLIPAAGRPVKRGWFSIFINCKISFKLRKKGETLKNNSMIKNVVSLEKVSPISVQFFSAFKA